MYYIKRPFSPKLLDYGFKYGREYKNTDAFISNPEELDDLWLIADENIEDSEDMSWTIHINRDGRVWVDCQPIATYHIDSMDLEELYVVLYHLIKDGIIYESKEEESNG